MKSTTRLRRAEPSVRTRRGRIASELTRFALPVAVPVALAAAALLTGATVVTVAALVPTTVPTLLAGFAAAVGLTVALPLVAVRGVVALLEQTR